MTDNAISRENATKILRDEFASGRPSVAQVRWALSAGANCNATIGPRGKEGEISVLALATGMEKVELVEALVEAGADCAAETVDGHTPMMMAASRLWVAGMKVLAPKSDLGKKNPQGQSISGITLCGSAAPQRRRAVESNHEIAEALVCLSDRSALFLNERDLAQAAHVAVSANSVELLDFCAQRTDAAKTRVGAPPRPLLAEAALHGSMDCVKKLLALGCDPEEKGMDGRTAFMCAAVAAHEVEWWDQVKECIETLGPLSDTNAVDAAGETALMIGFSNGHEAGWRELAKWSDPNVKGPDGDTVLLQAISRGQPEVVDFLASISDLSIVGKEGKNAVDLAIGTLASIEARSTPRRWQVVQSVISNLSPKEAVAASLKVAGMVMPKVAPLIEARELELAMAVAAVSIAPLRAEERGPAALRMESCEPENQMPSTQDAGAGRALSGSRQGSQKLRL